MKLFFVLFSVLQFVAINAGLEDEGNEFEGDIILTAEQRRLMESGQDLASDGSMQRGASRSNRWPGGVVYYTIDRGLSGYEIAMDVIASAMKEWSEKTCITFRPRTTEQAYVNFQKGYGCSSNVGRTNSKQPINLASGCWHHGTVVHEIGHALGFWHEQSRPDRDNYVTILWDNIKEQRKFNFQKHGDSSIDSLGVPYDYGSIMHYGKRFFTNNGKDTIKPNNGEPIGQRIKLSDYDVKQMNLMYKCGPQTPPPSPQTTPPGPQTPPPSPQTTPPSPTCKDDWSECAKYGSKFCKSGNYMKRFCKKTCKNC